MWTRDKIMNRISNISLSSMGSWTFSSSSVDVSSLSPVRWKITGLAFSKRVPPDILTLQHTITNKSPGVNSTRITTAPIHSNCAATAATLPVTTVSDKVQERLKGAVNQIIPERKKLVPVKWCFKFLLDTYNLYFHIVILFRSDNLIYFI